MRGGNDARTTLRCSSCQDEIDQCEFCDDPDCGVAQCYGCVHLALGEIVALPHAHGG
jgi:hypothetical protein